MSVLISVAVSGVVNVARIAAQETASIPVTVFDSQQLSLGTGFLVETAARMAEAGHSIQEILTVLNAQIKRSHVFAALDTLEFLKRSGRITYAFSSGDFFVEGGKLLAMPWGIVSLVDLYVGSSIFSCWIVFREKTVLPSVLWVVAMMLLGFWAGALYTLMALQSSGGDWKRFWYGKRAS